MLLAQRSSRVSTFAGCWAGISGYVESDEPLHRALVEVKEECGVERSKLTLVRVGQPLLATDPATGREFLVHPFLFRVADPQAVRRDWEATRFEWVEVEELLSRRRQPAVPQLYEAFAAVWPPPGGTEATADRPHRSADSDRLLKLLLDPRTYGNGTASVELRETHISWVFLTDRHVYKVKKPVRFEFLEYGTPEARRRACEDEIRLNRRLAPHVYLGVVPIVDRGNGRLTLAGEGPAVEWAVKMRRLPADRMLDELIRGGRLTADDVASLAAALAKFYDDAPPLTLPTPDYRRRVEHHVRENLAELSLPDHDLPADLVRRAHQGQLRLLACRPEMFDGRVCDGRVIDGHGDLRPEHVCVEATPVVYDCVEFNADLRQIDVVDELCFLAVECELLGAPDVGRAVLDAYLERSGDAPPPELVAFYRAYRACVRAKVAALRSRQLEGAARDAERRHAERYLRLAAEAAAPLGRPLLLVVRGLMGTGKTTLARALGESLAVEVVSTDVARRELFGASPTAHAFGEGAYRAERIDQVYDEVLRQAADRLRRGLSVIVDGTYAAARHREAARQLAAEFGAACVVARCECPADEAQRRIVARQALGGDASEARPDLMAAQRAAEQRELPGEPFVDVDTTDALANQRRSVFEAIGEHVSKSCGRRS